MDRLKYKIVLPVIVVLALTACGSSIGSGKVDGSTVAGDPQTTGFSVELKDTSFFAGGTVEGIVVNTSSTESGRLIIKVSIDNAANLKGMFFDLHYDETEFHPVVAYPTELLAPIDSLLHLAILDDSSVVHFGAAMLNPDTQAGFNGSGIVATVEFEAGAAKAKPAGVRAASQVPQISLGWWLADTLFWKYTNPGDYDLNGEVNLADIVPVALHYGRRIIGNDARHIRLIDGDGNYEINLADITVIVLNYGNSRIFGYDLFSSASANDLPENNEGENGPGSVFENHIPFSRMYPEDSEIVGAAYYFDFLEAIQEVNLYKYYWIRPSPLSGHSGISSTSTTLNFLGPLNCESRIWQDNPGLSVTWSYDNEGDFNQDGLTSMGDLEEIIRLYGATGPFDYLTVQSLVDYDQNNEINVSDINGVIFNFLSLITGYNLYSSSSITDYVPFGESTIIPFHSVSMTEAIGDPSVDRLTFPYEFEGSIPAYVWVRSFGPDGTEGISSNLLVLNE